MTSDRGHISFTKPSGPAVHRAPHRPRVFVLSDSCLLREGVTLALAQQSSVQVVGSSDLSVSLHRIAASTPDALLLDISGGSSLDVSQSIHDAMPAVKIVALGVVEVEQVVMACAKAGVSGFVTPSGSAKDVVAAVHSAVRGELVCSPRTAGMLLNRIKALAASPPADGVDDVLTQREREIARLMSEGLSNKQIALSLGIRNATVKNHVHSVLGKLRVHRRGEAVARLHQARINDPKKAAVSRLSFGLSVAADLRSGPRDGGEAEQAI